MDQGKENTPELSIVSTIYNDEKIVPALTEALMAQADSLKVSYEIILVNDASADGSEEAIKRVCGQHKQVKGLSLARNYGQQMAVSSGIKHASGNYVLVIDGDMENPIDAIPALYHKIKEGFDIVYAIAKKRQSFLKRITSEMFWLVICNLLQIKIIKNQLLLRIMSRKLVDNYNSYGEISRSVAGITQDIGLRSAQVTVQPNKRYAGKSNYNFSRRLNIFIDIVLNLSLKPLNFVIFLGFFTFLFSILLAFYYVYIYFTIGTIPGFTSTILSIFFFGSIIVFTLGIMSRYLSLIYLEVRNRPLFIVKEKFNL